MTTDGSGADCAGWGANGLGAGATGATGAVGKGWNSTRARGRAPRGSREHGRGGGRGRGEGGREGLGHDVTRRHRDGEGRGRNGHRRRHGGGGRRNHRCRASAPSPGKRDDRRATPVLPGERGERGGRGLRVDRRVDRREVDELSRRDTLEGRADKLELGRKQRLGGRLGRRGRDVVDVLAVAQAHRHRGRRVSARACRRSAKARWPRRRREGSPGRSAPRARAGRAGPQRRRGRRRRPAELRGATRPGREPPVPDAGAPTPRAALSRAKPGRGLPRRAPGAGATGAGGGTDVRATSDAEARRTSYRVRDPGSTARHPSSSSSMEKPLIGPGSPRWARAVCSAVCHVSASTCSDSFVAASFSPGLPRAVTSTSQRIRRSAFQGGGGCR